MTLPDPLNGQSVSPPDTALNRTLHASLLRILVSRQRRSVNADTARSLGRVREDLRAGALDRALRHVDRAWRTLQDDAGVLSPVYGRLLMLQGEDHDAALTLLQHSIHSTPDPDVAALIALAQLRMRRSDEARQQLETALASYCVQPGDLLSHIAREMLRHTAASDGAPGWIGRGPSLELIGELAAIGTIRVLDISLDGQSTFSQLLPGKPRAGLPSFILRSAQIKSAAAVVAHSRGVALLGSGAQLPAGFALDARAETRGGRVAMWARLGWLPTQPLRLRLQDELGACAAIKTHRSPEAGWRWSAALDLRAAHIRGHRLCISAMLPNGRWQPFPDSPLLLEPALSLRRFKRAQLPSWHAPQVRTARHRALSHNERRTDIVVPVHGGREQTLACLDTVMATIDRTARIVVVDDATEDNALASALGALAAQGHITLLRNEANLGFVASANRGMALHAERDVVLLNSDTLVFDDWLARLRAAAYSEARIGTVTPLSNNGTIASYPQILGSAMAPEDAAELHALAAATLSGFRPAIPVGVGFCLYLRRDCLREVGALDAVVFGHGYGEETDFCLRARGRGWSHRLAADVFVYHAGAVSFGSRRAALMDRSARLINLRHPGYDRLITSFLKRDPLQRWRRALDERRLGALDGRFVLLVASELGGGVSRFVTQRCRTLRAQGLLPLVLRAAQPGNARRCELWTDALSVPNLRYDIPSELTALGAVLARLDLAAVEIQHFVHIDARVIEAVRALPVPYDVVIHDYAWICPRVTLIDGRGHYCGEPAVSVCESCVRRNGSNLGVSLKVAALRSRSAVWLLGARQVIAPSHDAAARLRRHFENLNLAVQPHAMPALPTLLPARAAPGQRVRVALIGGINQRKGFRALLGCARDARARKLPLEFVVIGHTQDDSALLKTGKAFITGPYGEGEAPYLLRRERPDVVWLPSVWPETWCYTLDLALGSGLPVAAFDLGAIAERLRAAGVGALMPLDLEVARINDRLLELAAGGDSSTSITTPSVQYLLSPERDDDNMTTVTSIPSQESAENPMAKPSDDTTSKPVAREEGLTASVQVLPLPPGLYLFSVKTGNPRDTSVGSKLSLPAVHVALGPGMQPEQVEFITGPSTHGAWLFATCDLLVTRVNSSGATLIITSVRAPGGEVLAISVERLDARAEAPQPAAATSTTTAAAPAAIEAAPSRSSSGSIPLPVQINAHVRKRGDMVFADVPWAGRVGAGLWVESFSLRPLERFGAQDIEYKGLTGSGFETPWLSDEKMCGTKGMATPLVGFAVRLKPNPVAALYDCEYSGYFQSGVTIGPLRNGAPCRSTVANDPLEGIQLRLVKRATSTSVAARAKSTAAKSSFKTPLRTKSNAGKVAAPLRRHPSRRP